MEKTRHGKAGSGRSEAGPEGWRTSKKPVTENALRWQLHERELNRSQGGQSEVAARITGSGACGRVRLGLKKGALGAERRVEPKNRGVKDD